MTPEEELAALIAEQEKDMRCFRVFSVSLDAHARHQFADGEATGLANLAYRDEDGYAVLPYRRSAPRFREKIHPLDTRHGTENGYSNLRCRCKRCRKAWASYWADFRKRRRDELAVSRSRPFIT